MSDHCREVVEMLYEYLDEELTEEHRIVIRRHLDDCPPCFSAFDFEVELRIVIAQKCRERVPQTLLERVAEALNRMELGEPAATDHREPEATDHHGRLEATE